MAIALDGIDHVALLVRDLERSQVWYEQVLGLGRCYPEWDVPVMMGVGGTAVALFSTAPDAPPVSPGAATMSHLAFRASRDEYERAKGHLSGLGVDWTFEDHDISHSIYFSDPDGHRLEITTYEI
jgi:catechol-2,3-dioxygenase